MSELAGVSVRGVDSAVAGAGGRSSAARIGAALHHRSNPKRRFKTARKRWGSSEALVCKVIAKGTRWQQPSAWPGQQDSV